MGGLEIGLLVFGLICLVISFFLSEKLSSSDINEFEKMSRADINVIVEKQLREADSGIKRMIDDGMNDAMEDLDSRADRLLNNKIMSISDYSDTVLTSIEKSHKEVIFMYNMLLEKQESLTELTKEIQILQSNLREIKANMEADFNNGNFNTIAMQLDSLEESPELDIIGEIIDETPYEPIENALSQKVSENIRVSENNNSGENYNQNDMIIKMHSEGFDEVEIAKRLGRGLGEIKLVLGLYNKE